MIGGFSGAPDGAVCSRAACTATATWRIDWRNPKIHTGDRGKTWLACDEHVAYLRDFLEARSFPVSVAAFDGDANDADAAAGGRA